MSAWNLPAAEPEATPGNGNWFRRAITSRSIAAARGRDTTRSKAIGEIAASTAVVHAVIDDVDSYPQFMPYTVECRVLKREGDSVLTYQRISAPLVSDRDYTLRVRTTFKNGRGRHQLSQPMGNRECARACGKAGSRSSEIVRRQLAARADGSECDARDLHGLHRQRRSDPCVSSRTPEARSGSERFSRRFASKCGIRNTPRRRSSVRTPLGPRLGIDNLRGAVGADGRPRLLALTLQVIIEDFATMITTKQIKRRRISAVT